MKKFKVENLKLKILGLAFCLSLFALIPSFAKASFFDDLFPKGFGNFKGESGTSVTNEINVSADSGGNTVNGGNGANGENGKNGEIKEGKTEVKVKIKSVVNGKEMEPTNIKTEGNKVEVKSRIEVKGSAAPKIEKKIKIDGETVGEENEGKDAEPQEDNLKTGNEKKPEIGEKASGKWIRGFLKNLKSFFQSIFSMFRG